MKITQNKEGSKLTIALEGRLDTTTAPELENELKTAVEGVEYLVFDLKELIFHQQDSEFFFLPRR